MAVGVPEITPVEVFKVNPAGSGRSIVYVEMTPPELVGVIGVMAVPV